MSHMTQTGHRKLSYFELLLCDTAVVRVQELEHMGNQISAAEIVGSQCSEQHNLSFAANLKMNKSLSDCAIYLRSRIIDIVLKTKQEADKMCQYINVHY